MEELWREYGYVLPEGERDIMSEEVGVDLLGFNLGPFPEEDDEKMAPIPTGALVRELLSRHPEALLMLVPPKAQRYSFFVTNESDNDRMIPLASEAINRWSDLLGFDE
jgi:hypothetical protein